MKIIKTRKITKWLVNTLELTESKTFISTETLFKDFCVTYKEKYDPNQLISFGKILSNIFKKLNWNIKKSRLKDKHGYSNLKFKQNITYEEKINQLKKLENQLYLETLEELNKKLLEIEKKLK